MIYPNLNITDDSTCDDIAVPVVQYHNPIKYTVIYYTIRNSINYLINNPVGLVKHYTRVYNQAFNQ